MTLPHNSATATLTIDGLAICCFNKATSKWEVGYLHPSHPEHHHDLILNIDGGPRRDLSDTSEIWIDTLVGLKPIAYPLGFFDRGPINKDNRKRDPDSMTPDEKENFRWVLDLEDPHSVEHGKGHLVNPGYPVTRAFISNAVFYTKKLPKKEVYNLSIDEKGDQMSEGDFGKLLFGRTNDVIGADITAAAIVITIIYEERAPEILMPLVHRPGDPWRISLTNMRPFAVARPPRAASGHEGMSKSADGHHTRVGRAAADVPEKGDFDLYYAAFKLDDPTLERALWGFPESGAVLSGRTDCNTVWVGTSDNLDALFEAGMDATPGR
jgi:hypothetical protein